jgi:hypothetical protein
MKTAERELLSLSTVVDVVDVIMPLLLEHVVLVAEARNNYYPKAGFPTPGDIEVSY